MKKMLKYLLPVIVAAAFAGGADSHACADAAQQDAEIYVYDDAFESSVSATESEFCVPRQVSFANTQQVQSTARRTVNTQRNSFEFAKSGKVINAGIRYFVQKLSIATGSRLCDPSHILFSLGKLII
jgi:hypothetical protein